MLRPRTPSRSAPRRSGRPSPARPVGLLLLLSLALAGAASMAVYAGPPLQAVGSRIYLPLLADGRRPAPTATATGSPTRTATATATGTRTATPTGSPSSSPTRTATATSTATSAPAPQAEIVWTVGTVNYPGAHTESQAIGLDGKLYTFGGFGGCCTPTERSYVFDPQASRWKRIAPLPYIAGNGQTGGGVTHAGIASDGTYIYLASGYIAKSPGSGQVFGTKQAWRYDPAANSYSRLPNLPLDRAGGQLAVIGRELHYFGGTNRSRDVDTPEHWSLNLDGGEAWVRRADLPNGRHHLGAVAYGGKIYVVGGQHEHDGPLVPQKDLHVYNPATDSWAKLADLPEGRNHIISTTLLRGDQIIVLGGQAFSSQRRSTVFVYDISANRWSESTPLPVARHSSVAGIFGDTIYFAGGSVVSPDTSPTMYIGTLTSLFRQNHP